MQSFNIGPMYGYPYPYAEGGTPTPMATLMPADGSGASATAVAVPADGAGAKATAIAVAPYPGRPPVSAYIVNAQLVAETSSPEQLAAAMSAAIEAGTENVSTFTKGPSSAAPSGPALSAAVAQATEQAKAMAQASAQAVGVTLGAVRSVVVLPATPYYGGPMPVATWQVQVRLTYVIQ